MSMSYFLYALLVGKIHSKASQLTKDRTLIYEIHYATLLNVTQAFNLRNLGPFSNSCISQMQFCPIE